MCRSIWSAEGGRPKELGRSGFERLLGKIIGIAIEEWARCESEGLKLG